MTQAYIALKVKYVRQPIKCIEPWNILRSIGIIVYYNKPAWLSQAG